MHILSQVKSETISNTLVNLSDITQGMIAGTKVETADGWCDVALVRVGDYVQTYDGGLKQVVGVERSYFGARHGGHAMPEVLHVPGGALGNCSDMYIMPQQQVLIESTVAEQLLNDPVVLMPALVFDGVRGISRVRLDRVVEAVNLRFAEEEVVFANTGVQIYCGDGHAASGFFNLLDVPRAKALIFLMGKSDASFRKGLELYTPKQAA